MSNSSKKSYILQKIEYLIELMEEVHDSDDNLKKQTIFPENYLEVQGIKDMLEKNSSLPPLNLIKLNRIYREVSYRKELLEHDGRSMTYKEYIEWKVKDILEDEDLKHPFQDATHYLRQNYVDGNGELISIEDAVDFVEVVREKHGIKKPKDIGTIKEQFMREQARKDNAQIQIDRAAQHIKGKR